MCIRDSLKIFWPTVKIFTLTAFYAIFRLAIGLSLGYSIGACLMIVLFYQDVVALCVPNTIKMPAMDH